MMHIGRERRPMLGTMKPGYQRGRISQESMHYALLKHTDQRYGELASISSAPPRRDFREL